MGLEFYIASPQPDWLTLGHAQICAHIGALPTFVGRMGRALCLKGFEHRDAPKGWPYDVRLFFEADSLLLEVSAFPPSITQDLRTLCQCLRAEFNAQVLDDDGLPADWHVLR